MEKKSTNFNSTSLTGKPVKFTLITACKEGTHLDSINLVHGLIQVKYTHFSVASMKLKGEAFLQHQSNQ